MILEYYTQREKYLDYRREAELKRLILQVQRANRVRNRQIAEKAGLKSSRTNRTIR